jgi:hypothetical protein
MSELWDAISDLVASCSVWKDLWATLDRSQKKSPSGRDIALLARWGDEGLHLALKDLVKGSSFNNDFFRDMASLRPDAWNGLRKALEASRPTPCKNKLRQVENLIGNDRSANWQCDQSWIRKLSEPPWRPSIQGFEESPDFSDLVKLSESGRANQVVTITGQRCSGKTWLLSALVERRGPENTISYFFNERSPVPLLGELLANIASQTIRALSMEGKIGLATTDYGLLAQIEVLFAWCLEAERPLVFVFDAIDEYSYPENVKRVVSQARKVGTVVLSQYSPPGIPIIFAADPQIAITASSEATELRDRIDEWCTDEMKSVDESTNDVLGLLAWCPFPLDPENVCEILGLPIAAVNRAVAENHKFLHKSNYGDQLEFVHPYASEQLRTLMKYGASRYLPKITSWHDSYRDASWPLATPVALLRPLENSQALFEFKDLLNPNWIATRLAIVGELRHLYTFIDTILSAPTRSTLDPKQAARLCVANWRLVRLIDSGQATRLCEPLRTIRPRVAVGIAYDNALMNEQANFDMLDVDALPFTERELLMERIMSTNLDANEEVTLLKPFIRLQDPAALNRLLELARSEVTKRGSYDGNGVPHNLNFTLIAQAFVALTKTGRQSEARDLVKALFDDEQYLGQGVLLSYIGEAGTTQEEWIFELVDRMPWIDSTYLEELARYATRKSSVRVLANRLIHEGADANRLVDVLGDAVSDYGPRSGKHKSALGDDVFGQEWLSWVTDRAIASIRAMARTPLTSCENLDDEAPGWRDRIVALSAGSDEIQFPLHRQNRLTTLMKGDVHCLEVRKRSLEDDAPTSLEDVRADLIHRLRTTADEFFNINLWAICGVFSKLVATADLIGIMEEVGFAFAREEFPEFGELQNTRLMDISGRESAHQTSDPFDPLPVVIDVCARSLVGDGYDRAQRMYLFVADNEKLSRDQVIETARVCSYYHRRISIKEAVLRSSAGVSDFLSGSVWRG